MTVPESPLERLTQRLEEPATAARWLHSLGIEDTVRGHANLTGIATAGMPLDLLSGVCTQLEQLLPQLSDPDLALNTLERFVATSRSPLSLGSLFEQDPAALQTLMQLFSSSRFLGDVLVNDPEAFELVRMTEGKPVERNILVDDICGEIAGITDRRAAMSLLRRHKRRELLRIAYGDLIRQQRLPVVTQQLSYLADALCEAALLFAYRALSLTRGLPRRPDGHGARFVILALGKLGGVELNFSSDIDLVFIYDGDGKTDGEKQIANSEFFERLAQDFIKLLTESTDLGTVYRVDMRLRPHGQQGPLVISLDSGLQYYDVMGRTWERQAYVKARAIAGDTDLGNEFLATLQPWIYRRYLNRADITGVKALKRKIEQRAAREGMGDRDVKSGRGGIRDIEFVIQFLQLLNGSDLPELRTGNTLEAIDRLADAGCLNMQEHNLLSDNYVFLRRLEHLLQIKLDVQTHSLPDNDVEMTKLAVRMGYQEDNRAKSLQAFKDDYRQKTELNRRIVDHLLHDAFADDPATLPEVDLILDPDPSHAQVEETLAKYGFRDVEAAYRNLLTLATERIPFLSTRRCRHFLASIAPALLRAVGQTPDPDGALVNLCHVSDSLGGKGVLWELFSFNPPSLQLYVRLCATSPYLSTILTGNPGMLDELMDSLVLNKLPNYKILALTLKDRLRGAEDSMPILHSFKNAQHLTAGVRDVLGKESVRRTTQFLSDVAEVCVQEICEQQYRSLIKRYGQPWHTEADRPCELVLLAMGKFGGSEPNYHSDLDVVFLYEAEGSTRPQSEGRSSAQVTSNQHFFSELAQRIIKTSNTLGPFGRLFELDAKLRPSGSSGSLAVSLSAFANYFDSPSAQLWERQALCRARTVYGSTAARGAADDLVRRIVTGTPWQTSFATELQRGRTLLEQNASARNLKRSAGGIVDVEFVVQMLQLKHAATSPDVLRTGTLEGLQALQERGYLVNDDAASLAESYIFLRSVEAHLRLMNTAARHDLPNDPRDLQKLAYLLNTTPSELAERCQQTMHRNREIYQRLLAAELALEAFDEPAEE
ncbi:MAG: bifunctional [glutamate--ammonia ligase]-adenylyl-L-tyrosine phosphorylase/[glutamate--ammonia-ligase] adenylyltransferase [Planctomycetales bacterium]|nr:bifunctional [glutamate--ammonia ligase]-adenylyl-L-tyrosine phosphorylase/[glutamate--ammonia-ligase] adenylyltransferase [Planctomycetales bacterium]